MKIDIALGKRLLTVGSRWTAKKRVRCVFVTALSLIFVGAAFGQSLVVTSSGSAVTAGQTLNISQSPAMPSLVVSVAGLQSCDTIHFSLKVHYTAADKPPSTTTGATYTPNGGTIPGNQSWTVSWNSSSLEGGTAVLTWSINSGTANTFTFLIHGLNPTVAVVEANTTSVSAWFFRRIINWESGHWAAPNNLQFASGVAVFGPPHGFGMGQLDPPSLYSGDADLWNWNTNLSDAIKKVGTNTSPTAFWNKELAAQVADKGPNPTSLETGACNFAYPVVGSENTFVDANWMHLYNGGYYTYYLPHNANGPGIWEYNKVHSTGPPPNYIADDYVADICKTSPI